MGRKQKNEEKIRYTEGEPGAGKFEIIDDFLPAPKDIVLKDDTVEITIALNKESIDFFKTEASKHHVSCHQVIKNLLDRYAHEHR